MSRDGNRGRQGFGQKVKEGLRNAAASVLRGIADKVEVPQATFEIAESKFDFGIDVAGDTLWATQQQIASLFERDANTIVQHLNKAFSEGEITRDATTRKFRVVRMEGSREIERETDHYNLDAILAVGMRVKSPRATQFRQWAFRILKEYVVHGYALDERRLRDDPEALQSLVEKVRALRVEEKNLYARVRDCFKLTASDYDPQSDEARRFYAALQEKFTYAASEHTTADLILARADGSKAMMGMSTYMGDKLTLTEARKGKNYLLEEELHYLRLVADAFLIFVEGKAMKGKKLTMAELLVKMDKILEFNEMPVFPGYRNGYQRDRADAYAKAQYELFKSRTTQERYATARRLPPA